MHSHIVVRTTNAKEMFEHTLLTNKPKFRKRWKGERSLHKSINCLTTYVSEVFLFYCLLIYYIESLIFRYYNL